MKILLTTHDHLGDVVILTNVLYNLKQTFPNIDFNIYTKQYYKKVFDNNPYISNFDYSEADFMIKVEYHPFSQKTANGGILTKCYSNNAINIIKNVLKLNVENKVEKYVADLYLTEEEKQNKYGDYCLINANCQSCSETKNYPFYQSIIDAKKDMTFIQIGSNEERNITNELKNVIDLRGKTNVRELISLVYNSKYIITPVSAVVHIASAFKDKTKVICLSGAREPVELTSYSNVIHMTSTCIEGWNKNHGCMKFFMRDIDIRTCPYAYIQNNIKYPRCMADIDPQKIVDLLK